MSKLLPYFQEFESFLADSLENKLSTAPEPLRSAMTYYVESGGKRIRPCLFLNTYALFKPVDSIAFNFATAIELFHTFTLVHDDLPCMDNDDVRRGRPSCHKVFGEGQAVLAGDALQNLSYNYILSAIACSGNNQNAVNAATEFNRYMGADGLHGGQCIDIQENSVVDAELINYIFTHKTCDLICASMVCAAIATGANSADIEYIREYAYNFGYIFQIVDDLLDKNNLGKEKNILSVMTESDARTIIMECQRKASAAISKLPQNTEFFISLLNKSIERKA